MHAIYCVDQSQAAVETRVLVQEVAERHDIIVKLKNEINDLEQQLKQKDTHIQFKDEIIKELRQHRRPNVKVRFSRHRFSVVILMML